MSRFLRIQIYNEQGTEIEYDNYVDDFWGIQAGSASLETRIMDGELKFGDAFASMFQVQVFGIDDDLSNRLIQVSIVADDETNYILSHDNKKLITHDGSHIVHSTSGSSGALFYGTIDSTKKDRMGTYRNIIAYDAFYSLREFNCIDFWNDFWENHEETTLLAFKQALFTYLGLDYVGSSLINDSLVIHNPAEGQNATILKFGDLIRWIYQLQNGCPHINGVGVVIDITLTTRSSHDNIRDVRGDVEGENSSWEDFETEEITGIGVYSTGQDLAQTIGEDGNTYNIVGNVFLLDMSAQEINDVCEPLLEQLSDIQFTPCVLKMKLPRQRLKLGDMLYTDYGVSYAFSIRYANSVLIDETVSCDVKSATLNKDLSSIDDIQFIGNKYAILTKDIDGLHTEFGNLEEEVHSEIEQTASQIVLKVDDNGDIVEVALGTDPDEGTVFQVGADNIEFIANNTIQLTANSLAIDSTNFSVTSDGHVTAKALNIQGGSINITTSSEYSNYLVLSATSFQNTIQTIGYYLKNTDTNYTSIMQAGGAWWYNFSTYPGENLRAHRTTFVGPNNGVVQASDRDSKWSVILYNYSGSDTATGLFMYTPDEYNSTTKLWSNAKHNFYVDSSSKESYLNCNYITASRFVMKGDASTTWSSVPRLSVGFTGAYSTTYKLGVDGSAYCSGTWNSSSIKIKENIEPITEEEALKILDVNVVKFDYKKGDKDRRGVIAEELVKIFPNMVNPEFGEEGDECFTPMGVNYTEFIPYLIKMVQMQQEEINKLKGE